MEFFFFWRYTQNPRVVAICLLLFLILRPNKMVFFSFLEVYPKSRGILAIFSWCSSFLIPNNGVLHFLKVWQILSLLITSCLGKECQNFGYRGQNFHHNHFLHTNTQRKDSKIQKVCVHQPIHNNHIYIQHGDYIPILETHICTFIA